ncbi:transport and Golgi organization protein 6-like [Musca domestica]|uniref:Transport and Golgi organization protein 6-like n=1 Tax=Musca domestica TaxID=7370 RepID=A0ABM3VG07_MUSDO|nr:transport and Golgi organization protein 6-like [Musca domestica]
MSSPNVMKYWLLLESLIFPGDAKNSDSTISEQERIAKNNEVLQRSMQLSPTEVAKILIEDLEVSRLTNKEQYVACNVDEKTIYSIYLLMTIRTIYKNTNFNSDKVEDLISEHHRRQISYCIEDIAENGLKPNIHCAFRGDRKSIFGESLRKDPNLCLVELLVEGIASFMCITSLPIIRSSDEITLCYIAALYTLIFVSDLKGDEMNESNVVSTKAKLNKLWGSVPKVTFFRNLMMLYGMVENEKKSIVHRDLLLKLWSPGGFVALLFAMQKSDKEEQSVKDVVVKLVSQPSYPKRAQASIVNQILCFLKASIDNKDAISYMGTGLISLRKLCENSIYNRKIVEDWLIKQVQPLLDLQKDCLTVMEWSEFSSMVHLFFQAFCTSTIECLPSEFLVPFIPLLITLYQYIDKYKTKPFVDVVCNHLSHLILRILNNRTTEELNIIIMNMASDEYPKQWLKVNSRVRIEEDILNSQHLKIVQREEKQECDSFISCSHVNSLAELLKKSSFSTLALKVFIILFKLFPTVGSMKKSLVDESMNNMDLLICDEDIQSRVIWEISNKYNGKIQIINALHILIEHKPLKSLLMENISELISVIEEFLVVCTEIGDENSHQLDKNVVVILLTLIREIVENGPVQSENVKRNLLGHLLKLQATTRDRDLNLHIVYLKQKIENGSGATPGIKVNEERFEEARTLLESKEPYKQVEGIQLFINLIKSKDVLTISNVHVIMALALNALKSPESYTFLNCVRLFASMVYLDEHIILETLTEEYLNESAGMDDRLLIGEALLKVCYEIGPLCYKYKNILLNCYMFGCRSPLDEFRFSSFSNLAQMCKILSYDVHKYFQELLNLINCELTSGKYVPAKRAAVMVLSELLSGMDNLIDFQEMLLPIYRLLKFLASSERTDEKIRLHASVGLETLAKKTKEFLSLTANEMSLEKEIQIRGIKTNSKHNFKSHILYMD